jgi:D-tyrosyl-tRNA(Tyr) deacylase
VDSAGITVAGQLISSIGKGLLVFLGVKIGDERKDAEYLIEKVLNLRIFEDDVGKMNFSLLDLSYEMLVVSQFTLLGDCRKGRRPSFTSAEKPDRARLLYDYFISRSLEKTKRIASGEFQAMMKIQLVNDGPVTIMLDSKKLF